MREVWSLPGYEVERLLGAGAAGEVWRARCLSSGETVALRRLPEDAGAAALGALRREAVLLRDLDTPYVVRLREVVPAGARVVLVLDHADGGSLAALLRRRGALEPGEVVTVAAPVAQALAAAHGRGLVHGGLTAADVLFTADGMPVLSGLGLSGVLGRRGDPVHGHDPHLDRSAGAGREPAAAADVRALAALCHRMLVGAPPGPALGGAPLGRRAPAASRALVAAVEAALGADPAGGPDAATFAALLGRAHTAAPVRLSGGASAAASRTAAPPAPAARRQDRAPQGLLLGAALVGLLVLGGVAGWLSGRGGAAPVPVLPTGVPGPASSPGGWTRVLDGLDAARAQAFAQGDLTALGRVYAPGSAGLAADTALLRPLVDRQQTAHGLRHEVRRVQVLEQSGARARLRVVDVLAGYDVRDAAGVVTSRAPPRRERAFLVQLARTAEGWRLVDVRPQA